MFFRLVTDRTGDRRSIHRTPMKTRKQYAHVTSTWPHSRDGSSNCNCLAKACSVNGCKLKRALNLKSPRLALRSPT